MKKLFKLPKLSLKNPHSLLVYAGIAIVGYIVITKITEKKPIHEKLPIQPSLMHSDKIELNISPSELVQSGSFMILDGAFLDNNNAVVTVPQGYYYIFRDTGLSTGYQFVYAGTLGKNVSNFHTTVPTTFFQDGSYEVVVSDEPLPDNILHSGSFANPPYEGETSFKDTSNVIKNAIPGFNPNPPFPIASNPGMIGNVPPTPNVGQDLAFQ